MKAFKLSILTTLLAVSGASFAQNASIDDVAKAAAEQAINMKDPAQPKGVVNKLQFPRAAIDPKGSSKSTWKFVQSDITGLTNGANNVVRAGQSFRPVFSAALLTGGVGQSVAATDVTLMMAIAARESRFNPNAISPTGARGLMQITGIFYKDATTSGAGQNKARTIAPTIQSVFNPPSAIKIASFGLDNIGNYLNKANWTDMSGQPRNNVANVVRAYNGGHGEVISYGTKERLVNGVNKEAFQYPYFVGYYYYLLGGNRPYFKHFFEGNDPYLLKRGMGGTGTFDVATSADANETVPYSLPPQQCGGDYASPLEQSLVVSGTYGNRYDFENQRQRSKNSVDFVAAINTPVKAMGDGVVLGVERSQEMGNVLMVKNTDGSVFGYGSVKDVIVYGGQSVKKGDVIAKIADSNAYKSPQLMLTYFPDSKADLSLNENNGNHQDPLSVYCGAVDIQPEMLTNVGALSEMVTTISQETANSLSGAINAMIENRIANKQWLIDIGKMPEARLYAELAYINAISLKQDQMLQMIQEKTSSIIATQTSLTNEKTLGKEAETIRSVTNQ